MSDPDSPIDDAVELPPPAAPLPPPPRRASMIGPVIGGIIAAMLGYGLAQFVPHGWPIADTTALQSQLAAQADALAAFKTKLAELPQPDTTLSARVTALEQAKPADTSALDQRIAALETQLTAMAAQPADGSAASAAALAQLQADVTALKTSGPSSAAMDAKLADADAKLAAVTDAAQATVKATAANAAIGQIAAALDSGAPFTAAVDSLAAANLPAVLTDHAKTGLPSLQALTASFPDAARVALDASLRANMGDSWTARASAFLRNQTGARSLTPREGTDPDAVLSRAEAALNTGDLATTLAELATLPPEGQAAMADWLARCTLRQQAIIAVQALSTTTGG